MRLQAKSSQKKDQQMCTFSGMITTALTTGVCVCICAALLEVSGPK